MGTDRTLDALHRGAWTGRNHTAFYSKEWVFTHYQPDWVFGSNGPLAGWCQTFPHGANIEDRDVYQFGVYTGGTMSGIVNYFRALHVRFGTLWGFDSFEGLPSEAKGHKLLTHNWRPGAYSAADALHTWSWSNLERRRACSGFELTCCRRLPDVA